MTFWSSVTSTPMVGGHVNESIVLKSYAFIKLTELRLGAFHEVVNNPMSTSPLREIVEVRLEAIY